jgi:hypothetical protein
VLDEMMQVLPTLSSLCFSQALFEAGPS